jgi:hypothetical protein
VEWVEQQIVLPYYSPICTHYNFPYNPPCSTCQNHDTHQHDYLAWNKNIYILLSWIVSWAKRHWKQGQKKILTSLFSGKASVFVMPGWSTLRLSELYVLCSFCVNHRVNVHLYTSIFSIRSHINHFFLMTKILIVNLQVPNSANEIFWLLLGIIFYLLPKIFNC